MSGFIIKYQSYYKIRIKTVALHIHEETMIPEFLNIGPGGDGAQGLPQEELHPALDR